MHISSIAKAYAKAFYETALKEKLVTPLYRDVCTLSSFYRKHATFRFFVNNPTLTKVTKKKVIGEKIKPFVHERTLSFLLFVIDRGRYAYFEGIWDAFIDEYKHCHHIQMAKVSTVAPLPPSIKKKIIALVTRLTGHTRIELKEHVNPSLLGGYVLQIGDRQIDLSIFGQLNRLKYLLLQS